MAVIYLCHPVHGAKVATLDIEAEYDIQNGWALFDPENPGAQIEPELAEAVADEPETVNLLAEPRRRGRPRKE